MPSKKLTAKKPSKTRSTKRAKNVLPLVPSDTPPKASWMPIPTRERASKRDGVKIVRVCGGDRPTKSTAKGSRTIKIMPNPWPPDTIEAVLTVACSTYGGLKLASIVYETIKHWLDVRKARKVRIKKGDIEIEIQAGMTTREIEKIIDVLVKKTRELEDEKPKIIIPSGIDRSIPKKE